jgi:Leucine-rich repeat (LRR) protein
LNGSAPSASLGSNMTYINLDNNEIASLPTKFEAPGALYLSIAHNRLKGNLPDFRKYPPSLVYCDLHDNMLSGSIDVVSDARSQNWSYLALDNNILTGSLPGEWRGNVSVLLLQNNAIKGCLPKSWVSNDTLTVLDVSNNSMACLTGLPESWAIGHSFQHLSMIALHGNTNISLHPVPQSWFSKGSF